MNSRRLNPRHKPPRRRRYTVIGTYLDGGDRFADHVRAVGVIKAEEEVHRERGEEGILVGGVVRGHVEVVR